MMPSQLGAQSAHASMMHVMSTPQRSQNHTDRKATQPGRKETKSDSSMSMAPEAGKRLNAPLSPGTPKYIGVDEKLDALPIDDIFYKAASADHDLDLYDTSGKIFAYLPKWHHYRLSYDLNSLSDGSKCRRILFFNDNGNMPLTASGHPLPMFVKTNYDGVLKGSLGADATTTPASDTYSVWTLSAIATATLAAGLAIGHTIGKHKKKAA